VKREEEKSWEEKENGKGGGGGGGGGKEGEKKSERVEPFEGRCHMSYVCNMYHNNRHNYTN
jgi:hypothetical protein